MGLPVLCLNGGDLMANIFVSDKGVSRILFGDFFFRGGHKIFLIKTHQQFVYMHFCYVLRVVETIFGERGGGVSNLIALPLDAALVSNMPKTFPVLAQLEI